MCVFWNRSLNFRYKVSRRGLDCGPLGPMGMWSNVNQSILFGSHPLTRFHVLVSRKRLSRHFWGNLRGLWAQKQIVLRYHHCCVLCKRTFIQKGSTHSPHFPSDLSALITTSVTHTFLFLTSYWLPCVSWQGLWWSALRHTDMHWQLIISSLAIHWPWSYFHAKKMMRYGTILMCIFLLKRIFVQHFFWKEKIILNLLQVLKLIILAHNNIYRSPLISDPLVHLFLPLVSLSIYYWHTIISEAAEEI